MPQSAAFEARKGRQVFNGREYRSSAFADVVALILLLARTAMVFNALEPDRRASDASNWEISMPEPNIIPSFGS